MFINFGEIEALNNSEQITFDMYSQVQEIISTYINKGIKLDEYGYSKKATPIWEYGNKVVYLVVYLTMVRERILKDLANNELEEYSFYADLYKLDCIKKTFSCFSIPFNVEDLYAVYGVSSSNFSYDGISYMTINDEDNNIFEINKQ